MVGGATHYFEKWSADVLNLAGHDCFQYFV